MCGPRRATQRGDTGSKGSPREGVGLPQRDGERPQGVSEANGRQSPIVAGPEGFQMLKNVCQRINDRMCMIEEQLQSMQDERKQWSGKHRLPSLDVLEITNKKHGEVCTASQRRGGRAATTINYLHDFKGPRCPFGTLAVYLHVRAHASWLDVQQAWRCLAEGKIERNHFLRNLFWTFIVTR